MIRMPLVLFVIFLLWAFWFGATARAYEVPAGGPHQTDLVVTWEVEDPSLRPYVQAGLQPWVDASALYAGGEAPNADVVVRLKPIREDTAAWTLYVSESPERGVFRTVIEVNSLHWPNMTDTDRLLLITHEWGHALGLAHSNEPSVLGQGWTQPGLSPDDIAGIRSIYGPDRPYMPYRVIVGPYAYE